MQNKALVFGFVPVFGLGAAALLAFGAYHAVQASSSAPSSGNPVVRVTTDEWNMKPNIASVPAGDVTFVVTNKGKLDHEVVILKTDLPANGLKINADDKYTVDESASGEVLGEVEDARPGQTKTATFSLTPGHYLFVCNQASHYKAGMVTAFEVK